MTDDTLRRAFPVLEYGTLEGKITSEGVIIDVFDNKGEIVATRAAMADEIFFDMLDEFGFRTCDDCYRIEDAGAFPDWADGVCEDCDPSILERAGEE